MIDGGDHTTIAEAALREESVNIMVKVGDFTLELVRADTKESFKEHIGPAPNNHVFAEVEPGVDYFIRVGSSIGRIHAKAKVDGVSLGYSKTFKKPDPSKYIGSWERTNGVTKTTALRFNTTRVKGEGEIPTMLTGKVEVTFSELGEKIKLEKRDVAPKVLSSDPKVGGKKCVVSTNGTHVLGEKKSSG